MDDAEDQDQLVAEIQHEATYDPDSTYVVVVEWVDGDVTVHGPYDVQEAAVAAAHDMFQRHQQVCLARHRRLTAALWTERAAEAHLTAALRVLEG